MTAANPALDPRVIDSLRHLTPAGEADLVGEVLTLFRAGAPARLAAIRSACLARDLSALQRTAHEFKGAAATIGAFGLQQCCRDFEFAAKAGTLEAAADLLDALDAEYARVDAAITELLRKPTV